jgi:hypothetical protein
LFSHSSALFCAFLHSCKTQLVSFQAIPHSFAKTPGGGGLRCISRSNLSFLPGPGSPCLSVSVAIRFRIGFH